eukprot:TRINITY_DN57280_c0_g1_i1.p1 TRINITY_DN57280_c0_g1~~TRINITY_DN57280_c0_g1_i1.p1  ORF type:complete len:554 (+),score=73.75 TRINITY_DN57280_c0_g1_i1:108-1664(+)
MASCIGPMAMRSWTRMNVFMVSTLLCWSVSCEKIENVVFRNFRTYDLELQFGEGDGATVIATVPSMGEAVISTNSGDTIRVVNREGENTTVVSVRQMRAGDLMHVINPRQGKEAEQKHATYLDFVQRVQRPAEQSAMDQLAQNVGAEVRFLSDAYVTREIPMAARFVNFRRFPLDKYWDSGSQEIFDGTINPMEETMGVISYSGHSFNLYKRAEGDKPKKKAARFTMDLDKRVYTVKPHPNDTKVMKHPRYIEHQEALQMETDYLAKTGLQWLGTYPARPPSLNMHSPGHFPGEESHSIKVRGGKLNPADLTVRLTALSPGPPFGPSAFLVEDLLNEAEIKHIVDLAQNNLVPSRVGDAGSNLEHNTRTSRQTWLKHDTTPELADIHKKFADVFGISESDISNYGEQLQFVNYEKGQNYAPHYDFSRSPTFDRMATLLIYLQPADVGGGTSFPRAFNSRGLVVKPKKGSAILFYNILPDGNLDEFSLHGAEAVEQGIKQVCNLWLHTGQGKKWRKAEL